MPHPKSVAISQCTSISSIRTPTDSCPYGYVDPHEPKVIASFLIPYKVSRDPKRPGEFKANLSISKHAILYGSLLQLLEHKQQNFKWVGVLQTTEDYSPEERAKISGLLADKGCYPIYMKMTELLPYYNFYENVMKTLFHNFKSLYETDLTHLTHIEFRELWSHYVEVNQRFAQKIAELKG